MPFEEGQDKIGGRKQGSLNKTTLRIKEAFGKLLDDNLDNMTKWLELIAQEDPEAAVKLMLEMSKRFVPTIQQTQITGDEGEPLVIKIIDEESKGFEDKGEEKPVS